MHPTALAKMDQCVVVTRVVFFPVYHWTFHISISATVEYATELDGKRASLSINLLDSLMLLPNFSWQPIVFSSMLYLAEHLGFSRW